MADNLKKDEEIKRRAMHNLQNKEQWFVIFSRTTHMPYVECDEETYDDEVFVYFEEEEARAEVEKLQAEGERTQILNVESKGFLPFCINLFFMGVNCIMTGRGTQEEARIQLSEFVKRKDPSENPNEITAIENPELHLTALYFVQELRKQGTPEMTDHLKEMDEELKVHFKEGRFLVAAKDEQLVHLKKDDHSYQPLFTDYQEFWKFNRQKDFKPMIISADKLTEILKPETTGVVLNPSGVNLMLNVAFTRKKEV